MSDVEDRLKGSFARQTMMQTMGADLVEAAEGRTVITAPIAPHVLQQQGFAHAALAFAIGDSAAGYAALSVLPEGAEVVHPQPRQRHVGQLARQPTVALDQREVHHAPQQAARDARGATRAAGNFPRALGLGLDPHQPGATGDDQVQFLDRVELQPGRDAEAVAQGRRQQAQARGRAD